MAAERCFRLTLGLLGLICIAVSLYVLFLLSEIPVDDSEVKPRPAIQRFLRKQRAAENDDCLWILVALESVKTLTSPNYPEPYPSNSHCQWLLTTLEPNTTISIKIETLMIEPETNCRLDYLQVFLGSNDQAPSLGPFCGNLNNKVIHTNSSPLLLVFRSDSMYEDKGFSIDYFITTAKGCRELLTDSSDTLTSPGYPDNYLDDTDCSTLITVSQDKKILLNFDFVDLEYGENCTFDYIQIFDGKDKNATLLGQICQQSDVLTFESTTHSLLVHFHSDGTVNRRGYRARYSSADRRTKVIGNCHWESDENNGTITSPNYPENYPSFSNCSLWVRVPEGSRTLLIFDTLFLEVDSNCSYDFLQITEGSAPDSKLLGRYCGRRTEPKTLLTDGKEIKVEFQSDSFVEYTGFKLRYEFLKANTEKEDVAEEILDYDESFSFSMEPQNATLTAGSSHMLHCATEHPNARIRWLKGDVFLAGNAPLPGLKLLDNDTLWIQNMQAHLTGQYTCVAVSPEEDIVATAHIKLRDGSEGMFCRIEFKKTPSDSEFIEGDFAHLECLSNLPDVRLTWEKDGRPLQHREHVTVLKNGYVFMDGVKLEDAGMYSCVARDPVTGCVQKVSATLRVSEKSKIEDICGRSKFQEEMHKKPQKEHGHIVGGQNAGKGSYPWQVMLWEPERKAFCGATLLNERWILTAAHCLLEHRIRWDRIVIKLGKYDTERVEQEEVNTTLSDFSAVVKHPDFMEKTHDNDLALIRLRDRVHFTDHILPICLPDRDLGERLLAGDGDSGPRMGTVIGWGKLKEMGLLPRYLQEIKLPIVDQEICENSTHYKVTRNMFCAGYTQEVIGDSCRGDSGGPFMMKHEGKWYILGIVSWGEGCGQANKYGFYTRILNHLSWIEGIIKL